MFVLQQVDSLKERAAVIIRAEREKHREVYKIIEQHIIEDGAILGSDISIHKLLRRSENEKTSREYTYDIYSENFLNFSYKLANSIAEYSRTTLGNESMVMLKSLVPYKIIKIFYDQRPLITVYNRSNIHLSNVVVDKFKILAPEVLLIDIYQTLYLPNKADEWQDMISLESKVYRHFDNVNLDVPVVGGTESKNGKQDRYMELSVSIFEQVLPNSGNILIGEHAFYIYTSFIKTTGWNSPIKLPSYISILSTKSVAKIYADLEPVVRKVFGGETLTYKSKNVDLIKDFRLVKTTFKVGDKPVLYMYNSLHYELVPFINYTYNYNNKPMQVKLGNIFAVSRFLLIELYFVANMLYSGKISLEYTRYKTSLFIKMCKSLRSVVVSNNTIDTIKSRHLGKSGDIFLIFDDNPDNYLGVNDKEEVALKNHIKKVKDLYKAKNQSFYDYYPQLEYANNNQYRTVK